MDSGLLQLDASATDLLKSGVRCTFLLIAGLAIWVHCSAIGGRLRPRVPFGLGFALGCAFAALCGTIGLGVGMGGTRGLDLFLIVGVFFGAAYFWKNRNSLHQSMPRLPTAWTPDRLIGAALGVLAVLSLLLMLTMLTRPHVSYDILSYHLSIAHAFRLGEWGFIDGNVYSRMPGGAFILYGPMLSNSATSLDDPGVRVLLWTAIVTSTLLCSEIAGQLGGRWSARGLAAALFAWHPMVWGGLANAHNDLLVTLYALGAVSCLLQSSSRRSSPVWFALAGILGGSAVAIKFSALGIVAIPLAVGCALMARGEWRTRLTALLWLAVGGAIAFGPWMARAWWFGGHPLHPFMGVADGWSAAQAAFITGHHQPITPLDHRYWTSALARISHFGYGFYTLVSLVALGLGAALTTWWRRPNLAIVAIIAWLGFAALLTVRLSPDRFAMPSVAIGCVALGVIATIAWRRPIRRYGITAMACALALLSAPWATSLMFLNPAVFDRNSTMPEDILITAHEGADNGRVLLLFEARGRWFFGGGGNMPMMNTTWDVPPWAEGLRQSSDAEEFTQWLRDRGITVVVVNEFELGRLVDFYGASTGQLDRGFVGVEGNRERFQSALARYKPFHFAGFTPEEREVLLQFIQWSRLRAKAVVPAGQVARIWATPLSASRTAPAQNGDLDGDQ